MILRNYRSSDCGTLAELFYNTVHTVNAADYTPEQLDAWADGNIDLAKWDRSFLAHTTIVAEINGVIAGFGDIDDSGYLDRLYVHSGYQRMGVASAICGELERSVSAAVIVTHASVTARGFFEKRGYKVWAEQNVMRKGVSLTNYIMELSRG